MDNAEIERILRAIRTPLGICASGAAGRMRRRVDLGRLAAAERRVKVRAVEQQEARRVTRVNDGGWMPEAEARRLRKAIRISFCNSPHKRKYWTALLDMYAGPDAGKRTKRLGVDWHGSSSDRGWPGRAGDGRARRPPPVDSSRPRC